MSYQEKENTILIVEDNYSTMKKENEMIKKIGGKFKAICIHDNYDKIDDDFIKKNKITGIILDIELGDSKLGITIAKRIRNSADEVIKKIPIIVVSMLEEQKEEITKETQCDHFIAKPCKDEEIIAPLLACTEFGRFFGRYMMFQLFDFFVNPLKIFVVSFYYIDSNDLRNFIAMIFQYCFCYFII